MHIAIISDSHDNLVRLDQALQIIKEKKIKTIIHCGDVASYKTLEYLSKNFQGNILLSIGNVDEMHNLSKDNICLDNVQIFNSFGECEFENIKIAFVHFDDKARELAQTEKYDFVFYGHTHKPWEENIKNTKKINPGTLAGMFNRSTFAIFDTKTKGLELVIM